MVLNDADPVHVINPRQICRTKDSSIITRAQSKVYRGVYTKRRILENSHKTLPYGYKN